MRGSSIASVACLTSAVALAALSISGTTGALANDKAHELAQRFALEAETSSNEAKAAAAAAELKRKKAVEAKRLADLKRAAAKKNADEAARQAAQLKADETDMLAQARAELAELKAAEADADTLAKQASDDLKRAEEERLRMSADAEVKAEAEARARVAANKQAEADAVAQAEAAEAKAKAEQQAALDAQTAAEVKAAVEAKAVAEAKALADAKAAAEARAVAEADAAKAAQAAKEAKAAAEAATERAEAARAKKLADMRAEIEAKAVADRAEAARIAADEAAKARIGELAEAKSKQLADKLARRQASRMPKLDEPSAVPQATIPTPPVIAERPREPLPGRSTLGAPMVAPIQPSPPISSTRVTVLLTMEPGDRGIRRHSKSGDPVLCLGDTCYIGRGADRDAIAMSRHMTFGIANTFGARAGACSNQLTCTFRNIDLGAATADIQPIDLRILRHDRRETSRASADRTCRVVDQRLSCNAPVVGPDYKAWIVPEQIAARAGAEALEKALAQGLPASGTTVEAAKR